MSSPTVANSQNLIRRGARRRLRIWMVFMICFMGWAFMTLMDQIDRLDTKMSKLHSIEEQYTAVQQMNASLILEKQRLNNPEYIEQILKENHHMTKDGETLYIETK